MVCYESRSSSDPLCEDPGDSSISCKSTSTFKDGRGSYKRRKTTHSWTTDTPDLIDDGHAWRKCGQKVIHNAKHPRNHFRCTHKFDQGCKATKHIQQVQDHPSVLRTTYYGTHTLTSHDNHWLPSDYLVSPDDLMAFKSSGPVSGFSSSIDQYDGDDDVF
ncbi:WRKY transcription factor 54 [Pyrus ussuriensis x Pyrus communis]|uniref:WRKY transcription factor 54 n=1 Tax=Pyrus ussuriensis x Pyrus communis TaxID=2448454 RepID=A0A5N5HRF2_9ROSA|nr:WRKY transcription factor 54 [Pyrus ussuriensis x Pyrus communis]